jgi:hypothetical protein
MVCTPLNLSDLPIKPKKLVGFIGLKVILLQVLQAFVK